MLKKRIFVVDDCEWHNILLGKMLQDNGYDVSTFTNGISLLEYMQQQKPNLIISDINMPSMDGFELCRKLNYDSQFENLPIMLLSTLAKEEVGKKAVSSGAVGYIQKPFAKESLLDVVAQKL